MKDYEIVERQHKALLLFATIGVKSFLMAIVSSYVFCGSIEPQVFFWKCSNNVGYVGGSVAAVVLMGTVFGYYIIRIKIFDSIFAKIMKADFIVTAMYFAVSFTAPSLISSKVMIWLFGIWILGMLLAPFNKEKTLIKKITEYGALVSLGILLTAHFIPALQPLQQSFTLGMMVSSVLSIFGSGRHDS